MVTSKDVESFIQKNIGKDNFSFLSGYFNFASDSRFYCADVILDTYKKLDKGLLGKEFDIEKINNIKSTLSVDLLSKVMMSIEDLGAIIIALTDLKKFTKTFLSVKPYEARGIIKEISTKDNKFFFELLTYPDVDSLPLDEEEKKFLSDMYERDIAVLKKLFLKISEFVERHNKAFVKSKHGYPILMGIETTPFADGIDMMIPVITEPAPKTRVILSGIKIVELYFKLIRTTTRLVKELISSKLNMIQTAGFKKPFLFSHCAISEEEKKKIEEINKKCSKGIEIIPINIKLLIEGKNDDIKNLVEFFEKDWYFE